MIVDIREIEQFSNSSDTVRFQMHSYKRSQYDVTQHNKPDVLNAYKGDTLVKITGRFVLPNIEEKEIEPESNENLQINNCI